MAKTDFPTKKKGNQLPLCVDLCNKYQPNQWHSYPWFLHDYAPYVWIMHSWLIGMTVKYFSIVEIVKNLWYTRPGQFGTPN